MDEKEKEKVKKLFAYCRVSTEYQKNKHSIEIQEYLINKYITENKDKYEIIDWFKDDGISAFSYRPNFDKMMSRIEECDGIIFTKLDRVGRSNRHLANFGDILMKKKKDFIVTDKKENIDTTTKYGKLLFGMLSIFAEFEATLINERMMEGRAKHIAGGGKIGRNKINLDKYKNYIISLYTNNKLGCGRIASMLLTEHGIIVNYSTILKRLKDWKITIRIRNKKNSDINLQK